jgi:hypothetical protein
MPVNKTLIWPRKISVQFNSLLADKIGVMEIYKQEGSYSLTGQNLPVMNFLQTIQLLIVMD